MVFPYKPVIHTCTHVLLDLTNQACARVLLTSERHAKRALGHPRHTIPPQLPETWQHVEGGNLGLKMVGAGAKAQLLLDRELA